jgi:hypothetical protein
MISSQGGVVAFGDNAVQVSLPPGGVTSTVYLVYVPQSAFSVNGFEVERLFALEAYTTNHQPRKFTDFKKPVTIQVSYTPEQVNVRDEGQLRLYNFNSALNQWVERPSRVDTDLNIVTAELNYFGLDGYLYALMLPAASVQPKAPNDIINLAMLTGVVLVAFVVLWAGLRWWPKRIQF